jgi:hypothetical protein
MHLSHQIELLRESERAMSAGLRAVAQAHADDPEVAHTAELLASWSDSHIERLANVSARYARDAPPPPEALHNKLFHGPRSGPIGLLRDLQDLFLQASRCDLCWTLVGQAAKGARDDELLKVVQACERETTRALQWIKTVLKANAVQALVVA